MEFIPYKPRSEKILGKDWEVVQQSHHILRQRREELGLTQRDVAEAAGILIRQYTRFESGERDICSSSARLVLAVCAVLKLDPYTLFPEIEAYQKKAEREENVVFIPAKKATVIPVSVFIAVIRKIPEGKLSRWEDIESYLERIYGVEYITPADAYWEEKDETGERIPYWRIVGPRGHIGSDRKISKYEQMELLKNEGVMAEISNEQTQSYRVKNYKELLFDLDTVDAEEIKTVPNRDRTTATAAAELMFSGENIRVVPLEILQRIANGKMGLDEQYVCKAIQELKRRKECNGN